MKRLNSSVEQICGLTQIVTINIKNFSSLVSVVNDYEIQRKLLKLHISC